MHQDPDMIRGRHHLDHVVWCVDDLAAGAAALEALGMTVTPRMVHPFGTANHLAMFTPEFLELLGVDDASRLTSFAMGADELMAAFEQPGLWRIALRSDDIVADAESVTEAGFSLLGDPRQRIVRPVTLPDGTRTAAEFSICMPPLPSADRATTFFSHQRVPEAVWVPDWQVHDAGRPAVTSLCYAAEDLTDVQRYWEAVEGGEAVSRVGDEMVVRLANADLRFAPLARWRNEVTALEHVAVPDGPVAVALDLRIYEASHPLTALLAAPGRHGGITVAHRDERGRVAVAADALPGAVLRISDYGETSIRHPSESLPFRDPALQP